MLSSLVNKVLSTVANIAKKLPDNKIFHAYTITSKGDDYLTRVKFPRMFGWRPMLHNIHRPDNDPEMYNHPWKRSYSIILTGSYVEERLVQDLLPFIIDRELRKIRWFNTLHKEDFHRITTIEGPLWTLFIAGERQIINGVEWGFLDEKEKRLIPYQEYIKSTETIRKEAI